MKFVVEFRYVSPYVYVQPEFVDLIQVEAANLQHAEVIGEAVAPVVQRMMQDKNPERAINRGSIECNVLPVREWSQARFLVGNALQELAAVYHKSSSQGSPLAPSHTPGSPDGPLVRGDVDPEAMHDAEEIELNMAGAGFSSLLQPGGA